MWSQIQVDNVDLYLLKIKCNQKEQQEKQRNKCRKIIIDLKN